MADADAERRAAQRARQAAARAAQALGAPTKKQRKEAKKRKREGGGAAGAAAAAPAPSSPAAAAAAAAAAKSCGAKWREREFAGRGRNEFRKKKKAAAPSAEALARPRHDVVVIPIFWRAHPGEEAAVCAEAERVQRLLKAAGAAGGEKLDVWVDRTHKKSPGQKLAFWEEVGVRFRVEIGPTDAKARKCVVSRAGAEAGFASATKLRDVSSTRRHDLVAALRRLGMAKVGEQAPDDKLDAENDAEAAAHLAKWEAALADGADARQGQARTPGGADARRRQPALKIEKDAAAKTTKKTVFYRNDDEDLAGLDAAVDDAGSDASDDS